MIACRLLKGSPGLFLIALLSVCSLQVCAGELSPDTTRPFPKDPAWAKQVGARSFPASQKIFTVNQYGAVAGGKTLNSKAIQSAIDACAAAGGGIVVFAPGKYLTGSIFLKSGVHLRIDKGVEILGSKDIKDYPLIDTRIAGIEMKAPAALINVIDQKTVAITGSGIVNAQGKVYWDSYWALRRQYEPKGLRWAADYDAKRPRTLLVSGSSDVTLKGLELQQAGFWTVHILYSKYVTVDGLVIRNNMGGHGPSTDGIDIDSSSRVLVEKCDIDCNDDDFCLKSGRDWDGLRVNRPTEYIVIHDCIARKGGGLLTCGSETSGGIRHVLAYNLVAMGTGTGIRLKSAMTRGGTVEDILVRDVAMDSVRTVLDVDPNWNPSYSYSTLPAGYDDDSIPAHWKVLLHKVEPPAKGTPHFKDVYLLNIAVQHAGKAITATGLRQSLLEGFHMQDVVINARSAGQIAFAKGWTFRNLHIEAADGKPLKVEESSGMDVNDR